jgi:hypothetical protein
MQAVPNEEPEEEAQLEMFEGLIVQQYRLDPGSIGSFPSLDEEGQQLKLQEGDIVAIQVEMLITKVSFEAGYKGGIQHKARKRIHGGNVIDGSQQVVGVSRRHAS